MSGNTSTEQILEERLRQLEDVDLDGAKSFGIGSLRGASLHQWPDVVLATSNPDKLRNVLYYGFQPIYDILIENAFRDGARPIALEAFEGLARATQDFVSSYYMGEPDIETLHEAVEKMRPVFQGLSGESQYLKERNIDRNMIFPRNIRTFLEKMSVYLLDNPDEIPDFIVGCACGSSEIAFALAGIMDLNVGFIRRSWRRGDRWPRVVREQSSTLADSCYGSDVLVIEDYVCTGKSMQRVIKSVKQYEAANITGASVRFSREGNYLREIHGEKGFHLFELK